MSPPLSRFWKDVTLGTDPDGAGYTVLLDDRPFRLPGGARLATHSRALAQAIAAEWRDIPVDTAFRTANLPLTQMLGTQLERVAPDRPQIIGSLCAYGESDLLCYRASGVLGRDQDLLFNVPLEHFAKASGVMPQIARGVMPLPPNPALQTACSAALGVLGDDALTCISVCAPALGSLILALGLVHGWVEAGSACVMASLEECYQMKQWGEDEALLREIDQRQSDILGAMRFLYLSRQIDTQDA